MAVNGEKITTTPAQLFYVPEKGWTSAIELRAGDILVLVNGEYVTVEAVQHEILESPVKVYNFQVADFHTYYVGEQSVLVHNMGDKNGCGMSVGESGQSSVYRVLREGEDPAVGLYPKNPDATYTVEGHVINNSKQGYASQYISATTDINVATEYSSKTGNPIVEIDLNLLPSESTIIDLSTESGRAQYLKGKTANNFAAASSEVLITGYVPPEAIKGNKGDI